MAEAGDFVFNCQMGRGRTTTGMVSACLVSTTLEWDPERTHENDLMTLGQDEFEESQEDFFDSMDGPSEEEAYRQGQFHADILFDCFIVLTSSYKESTRLFSNL